MSKKTDDQPDTIPFEGFDRPESNYHRVPNEWTDLTARIDNLAELKIVQYIFRHTWGYQEYGIKKRITIDEFIHGRKRRDGSRIDKGTGLSEMSVRNGISKALEHKFIEVEVDDSDKARVKKFYSLKMRQESIYEPDEYEEVQTLGAGVQSLDPRGVNFRPRTEKETLERNFRNRNSSSKIESNDAERNKGYHNFQAMGDLLKKKLEQKKEKIDLRQIPESIQVVVREISTEFGEAQNARANLTRAAKLLQKSGKSEAVFRDALYQAKSLTNQQPGVRRKIPYFFDILEEKVGLKVLIA